MATVATNQRGLGPLRAGRAYKRDWRGKRGLTKAGLKSGLFRWRRGWCRGRFNMSEIENRISLAMNARARWDGRVMMTLTPNGDLTTEIASLKHR